MSFSRRGNHVASGIIVLAPTGMGRDAQVQVRPARAALLECRASRPYLSFSLWDDDPHILRPVLCGICVVVTILTLPFNFSAVSTLLLAPDLRRSGVRTFQVGKVS